MKTSTLQSLCQRLPIALCLFALCLAVGCSGGSSLEVPGYDPGGAASRAMKIYDKDGDGFVAGEELENAPGLKAAIKNLDSDDDGKVSQQEIADRVAAWAKMGLGVTMVKCLVTLDGAPLEGATIRFVPEEFMAGVIQEAVDVTTPVGSASPRIPKENRPSPDTPPGTQLGLYLVKISKEEGGKETIPAKYNTETILGQEVSNDDWAMLNNQVKFTLTTK